MPAEGFYNKISVLANKLLAFPLFTFQLIVLLLHPTLPAFFLLVVSLFLNLILMVAVSIAEYKAFLDAVIADFFDRFEGCSYEKVQLIKLLGSQELISEMDEQSMDSVFMQRSPILRKVFGNLVESVESSISVFQVTPRSEQSGNLFAGGASYNNSIGNSIIFLPEYKLPLQRFPKFLLYHEIGHALFLSNVIMTEFKALRLFYVLILFFAPFQLAWTWQSLLLFITFIFTSLDFFGNGLLMRVHRARLQSEVMADTYAIHMLTDAEKMYILNSLRSGKVKIYDGSLSPDENNLRVGRLIAKLEKTPSDESYLVPISPWDNHYRFLFLILLATNTYTPTYWHVLGSVVITVFLILIIRLNRHVPYTLTQEIQERVRRSKK